MVLSGTTPAGNFAGSYGFDVYIRWSGVKNIPGNYTDVTATLYVKSRSGGSYFSSNSAYSLNINGNNYGTSSNITVNGGAETPVLSRVVRVPHDAGGGKYFVVSGSFNSNINSWGNCSTSGGFTLDPIPRAYDFIYSSLNFDMDINQAILIGDNGSGFTAKFYVHFGNKRILMNGNAPKGSNVNYTCKASDFADQIPNATSGTGSLEVETWNGGTYIGKNTKAFTLKLPAGAAYGPKITGITAADQNSNVSNVMGSTALFIRKMSIPRITTTASSVYGATIREYRMECAGYTLTDTGNAKDVPLAQYDFGAGIKAVKVTVTDSRGRTVSSNINLTILEYVAPQITDFSLVRLREPATTIELKKAVKVATLKNGTTEKNGYTIVTRYKKSTATAWTNGKTETNTSANFNLTGFAIDSSYDFEIIVKDKFNTTTVGASVSTTKVLMDWYKDEGVGFNKMYESGHGAVDIADEIWWNGRRLLDIFYPIGTVYQSKVSTSPAVFMGGTWERIKGRVLVGVDESDAALSTPYKLGGSVNPLTKHEHISPSWDNKQGYFWAWGGSSSRANTVRIAGSSAEVGAFSGGNQLHTIQGPEGLATRESGDNTSHSNWQPFITVYQWVRTA